MPEIKLLEDGELSGTRVTDDGYLVANVRCARTGIQVYAGDELERPDLEQVRVYRSPDEVFSTDSLSTFAGKPATDNHPPVPVDASNWKQYAVGVVGNEVLRDGEYIRVPLVLMDADMVTKVEAGKREISMGYEMTVDFEPGTTPKGEEYDAVMKDLRMNHLAVVGKGRAGKEVRIGDSWASFSNQEPVENDGVDMTLRKVTVDGLTVETTEQGAEAIGKLKTEVTTLKDAASQKQEAHDQALKDKQDSHDQAIAAKDAELAKKDTKIAELEKQVLSDDALDKRVAQRAALVGKASAIAKDAKFVGKTDLEIMTLAVDAARGADFCKDKSPAYVEAAFDMIETPTGTGDSFRDAMNSRGKVGDSGNNGGNNGADDKDTQAGYENYLTDAWKGDGGK